MYEHVHICVVLYCIYLVLTTNNVFTKQYRITKTLAFINPLTPTNIEGLQRPP